MIWPLKGGVLGDLTGFWGGRKVVAVAKLAEGAAGRTQGRIFVGLALPENMCSAPPCSHHAQPTCPQHAQHTMRGAEHKQRRRGRG